jgi:uroporphyrinogen decarboxylase
MGLFENRTKSSNGKTQVPVWFMRQAGRYHSHYQGIKSQSNFMSMCKTPELACEVTMGPMQDFQFDAAILFSDLLFPLEQLGMGLVYNPGPILGKNLKTVMDCEGLVAQTKASEFYRFQGDALALLKKSLSSDKTLLGFTGAPFTLYAYAVEGSHAGSLIDSKKGFHDGRWQLFLERLMPEVLGQMRVQAENGADAICLFDTAAGELDLSDFKEFLLPALKSVTSQFKKSFPNTKIVYYSKLTNLDYLHAIEDKNIDVLGIDWRQPLATVLKELGNDYYIQGNLDPSHLHLPWNILEKKILALRDEVFNSGVNPAKWIMGLGHGVLQHTPEENVRKAVATIHERFVY